MKTDPRDPEAPYYVSVSTKISAFGGLWAAHAEPVAAGEALDRPNSLADRLRRAVERLEEKRDALRPGQTTERARLDGKIEGVKLAASYLEEGERIFLPEQR
jgi:hypothetical protein